jgi:hypothetical protein
MRDRPTCRNSRGPTKAANKAMIVTTTNNSISVTPASFSLAVIPSDLSRRAVEARELLFFLLMVG